MNELVPVIPAVPVSPLRQWLVDDMNMRHFSRDAAQLVRDVGRSSSARAGCRCRLADARHPRLSVIGYDKAPPS